jgi:succinoglycan biosynthesis transport protein ExoP
MQTGSGSGGRSGVAQAIDELDLGAVGRALWWRKWLILALTLLAAAIAFAAVNMVTPRYKSEARVLIETRENIFLRPEAERAIERGATVDQEAVTSQVQLILSRGLALDVIRKLKLSEKPEFDPVLRGPSVIRTVLGILGILKDPMSQTPEERVLKSYMDRLAAFQVDKSRVIAIEFESQDPELAARVVNTIAEGYLVLQQEARQEDTRKAANFYEGQIEKLRQTVAEAEAKVEQYRATTNLMIGTNNTTLSSQQLGDINAQVASARAQKADAESKSRIIRDALRRGQAADNLDVMNSELLRRLSEQQMTLRAQLAEQSSTLLDQHPRIKELRAQIADLDRQIRSEAERIAKAYEGEADRAAVRLQSLSTTLDQLKKLAASSNEQDVKLRALEREAKSQRDLLESWLAKYREAAARDNIGASTPEARIISRGFVSNTPSWPKKGPTVLVAALGMFTLAVGFILTGQLMSASLPARATVPVAAGPSAAEPVAVRPAEDITAVSSTLPAPATVIGPSLSLPALAATSSSKSLIGRIRAGLAPGTCKRAITSEAPPSAPSALSVRLREAIAAPDIVRSPGVAADTVEALAAALGTAGDSGRRVAVVGTRRKLGTTLAAISLARALAKNGRVVLVDLALETSNLAAFASDANAPGLCELVEGTVSFGQIITRDRQSRVHLITAGKGAIDADTILSSQRLAITLEALSRSYDSVVIDAGALPDIAPETFATLAPRAVLVADDLGGPATVNARERLLSAGFPSVSVLLSAPDGPKFNAGGTRVAA